MQLNPMATIATDQWLALPQRFPQLTTDAFVVMPNHIHGLLVLDVENRAPARGAPTANSPSATVGQIVGAYKSLVFNACLDWCKTQHLILGQLWQRNFHEHIVRDEIELNAWRQYIHDNPQRWSEDHENITP